MLPFKRISLPAPRLRCTQTPATCGTSNPRNPRHFPSPNPEASPTRQQPPSVAAATRLSADASDRIRQREFLRFVKNSTHLQQLLNSKPSRRVRRPVTPFIAVISHLATKSASQPGPAELTMTLFWQIGTAAPLCLTSPSMQFPGVVWTDLVCSLSGIR